MTPYFTGFAMVCVCATKLRMGKAQQTGTLWREKLYLSCTSSINQILFTSLLKYFSCESSTANES